MYKSNDVESGIELSVQLNKALVALGTAVIKVGFEHGAGVQLAVSVNNVVKGVPVPGVKVYKTSKNGF
jgi:hypothetical protein